LAVALLRLLAVSKTVCLVLCFYFFYTVVSKAHFYFCNQSADSLEEVVGLDVGYTGGSLHKRLHGGEDEKKYSAYLEEYVNRKQERKGRGPLASSVHSVSLHGNSYHGRKVITKEMRQDALGKSSDSAAGSVKAPSNASASERDWQDNSPNSEKPSPVVAVEEP